MDSYGQFLLTALVVSLGLTFIVKPLMDRLLK
jgi:hypothetical protein